MSDLSIVAVMQLRLVVGHTSGFCTSLFGTCSLMIETVCRDQVAYVMALFVMKAGIVLA